MSNLQDSSNLTGPRNPDAPTKPYFPTLVYLDVARAIAAIIVMSSHLRRFIFRDFKDVHHLNSIWHLFYFVTGLGREAVIVFFVLSGFLITSSISRLAVSGTWSLRNYLIRRLSRLWIVLIPALILTLVLDHFGRLINPSMYAGSLNTVFASMPLDINSYTWITFIGNIFFLQKIVVPAFGSDTPLWSLANEFWYYLLFPMFYFAVIPYYRFWLRLALFCTAASMCIWPLRGQSALGLVWLMGYLVYLLQSRFSQFPKNFRVCIALAALVLFAGTLAYSQTIGKFESSSDFILGIAFSALLLPLTAFTLPSFGAKIASVFASFSYTLYVVHLPFFAVLASILLHNVRLVPSLHALSIYLALFSAAIAYAYFVSLLFERNTAYVQAKVLRLAIRKNTQTAVLSPPLEGAM